MGSLSVRLREHAKDFLAIKIFLMDNEDNEMNLAKLKLMKTDDLIDLFNDLSKQQVKRMATRADAERRTIEELKKAGKLEEVIPPGEGAKAQRNITETANAGINDGTPHRGKVTKAAKKAQEKAGKPQPAAKPGKGKGEKADAPEKAKKTRGAPVKNPTYTAIAPTAKDYNPKGFKPQATSDRMVVLDYIRTSKGVRTRDQIVEHFTKQDVNIDAALYYLAKFGFVKAAE